MLGAFEGFPPLPGSSFVTWRQLFAASPSQHASVAFLGSPHHEGVSAFCKLSTQAAHERPPQRQALVFLFQPRNLSFFSSLELALVFCLTTFYGPSDGETPIPKPRGQTGMNGLEPIRHTTASAIGSTGSGRRGDGRVEIGKPRPPASERSNRERQQRQKAGAR